MTTTTPQRTASALAGAAVTAPVALFAGVVLMKFGWKGREDLPWSSAIGNWTLGHVFYVLGYLLLGAAMIGMFQLIARREGPRGVRIARGALVVGLIGTLAMLTQMVIDLRNGFLAGSRAELKAYSAQVHDIPALDLLAYGLVPALSLFGLVALVVDLAVVRSVPATVAVAVTLATVLIGTKFTALMVIGGVLLCLAMLPVGRAFVASGNNGRRTAG